MDFISLLANIAQIFSVIWMLLFGGKAISEIRQGRASSRPYTIRPSVLLNVILAFLVLFLSSALWFKLNTASGNTHVAPGTVLYRTDWSKGLDGWTQVPGLYGDKLQVINGQLTNANAKSSDITFNGIFLAPVHFQGVTNYLVETKMKILSSQVGPLGYVPPLRQANPKIVRAPLRPLGGCPGFSIIVRWIDTNHFRLGGDCFWSKSAGGGFYAGVSSADAINIDSNWNTYTYAAQQDKYTLTMLGYVKGPYSEQNMSDPHVDTSQAGQVGLSVGGMQVSISSFTVTAL